MGTDALLHLIQAVEHVKYSTKLRIDLVTRGAQPPGRTTSAAAVAQAPLVGLLRVILNEYPNLSGRGNRSSTRNVGIRRFLALE